MRIDKDRNQLFGMVGRDALAIRRKQFGSGIVSDGHPCGLGVGVIGFGWCVAGGVLSE